MPANVVLTGPRVPTVSAMSTTTDRLARFETAQEMIGLLIAARARAVRRARKVVAQRIDHRRAIGGD